MKYNCMTILVYFLHILLSIAVARKIIRSLPDITNNTSGLFSCPNFELLRGRDGRDGQPGRDGMPGVQGPPGQ